MWISADPYGPVYKSWISNGPDALPLFYLVYVVNIYDNVAVTWRGAAEQFGQRRGPREDWDSHIIDFPIPLAHGL